MYSTALWHPQTLLLSDHLTIIIDNILLFWRIEILFLASFYQLGKSILRSIWFLEWAFCTFMMTMLFKRIQGNVKMPGQPIYETTQNHFCNTFIALTACQTWSALEIWVVLMIYAAMPELPSIRNAHVLQMGETQGNEWLVQVRQGNKHPQTVTDPSSSFDFFKFFCRT